MIAQLGSIGDPCQVATDCSGGELAGCYPEVFQTGEPGFPDGYCTQTCDAATVCPAGSVCVAFAAGGTASCLDSCAAGDGCRDGYVCLTQGGVCFPECSVMGCSAGYVCGTTGECGPCTVSQDCPAGLSCVDGQCLDPTPPALSPVGGPCVEAADCVGGANAACLPEPEFPNGYCLVEDCAQVGCPEGSTCYQLQNGGTACLADCTTDPDCAQDNICAGVDAKYCLPACQFIGCPPEVVCQPDGHCGPGGQQVLAGVGGACAVDADCEGGPNAVCLLAPEFPDGYCVITDCATAACPAGSTCFQVGTTTACFDDCVKEADCRDGYICDTYDTCWPDCGLVGCPEGYACGADGECAPGTPDCTKDSECKPGETCVGGTCVPPGGPSSEVGDACVKATQCPGGGNAQCLPEPGFPEGYCSIGKCNQVGCPAGATCWNFGQAGYLCLDDCVADADCRPGYVCDEYDTCYPGCQASGCPDGLVCNADGHCGDAPPCTPTSCGAGMVCNAATGKCVPDLGWVPTGTPPACADLPPKDCTGTLKYCGELIQFDPALNEAWDDYPINGETQSKQWRSWARRDLVMLIKWATSYVSCMGEGWPGNGPPLGLGDMSEVDGSIPGTSIGQPGHPAGTHVDGYDMDIGYYQVNTPDNHLREVCDHTQGGQEQYHCVSDPYLMDAWRTSLFLGALMTSKRTRVIGVDGKVGPIAEELMSYLCDLGWLPQTACTKMGELLAYETTDGGAGWYYFHLHHLHISLLHESWIGTGLYFETTCLHPGCDDPGPALAAMAAEGIPGEAIVLDPGSPSARMRVKVGGWTINPP
jgi:hypothetical protein